MKYKPQPIDTARAKLPKGLSDSIDRLAENLHDQWALIRLAEGWTHGPRRSDKKKTHPCLIPFKDLPESEQEFNRAISEGAMKAIIALGHNIDVALQKSSSDAGSYGKVSDDAIKRLMSRENLDMPTLVSYWGLLSTRKLTGSADVYAKLGSGILKKGEPLLAYDIISTGAELWPKNVRLRQLLGLALAESGATDRANKILSKLKSQGKAEGETLGILARTYKDLWALGHGAAQLAKAYKLYCDGFGLAKKSREPGWDDDALYTGINAASTALLMGKERRAKALAREVSGLCLEKLKKGDDYWTLATLGEAAVIKRNWAEAEDWYSRSSELEQGAYRMHTSTRRQVRVLLKYLDEDERRFDHCFSVPNVVVFSGHMIDQPGRARPRFPEYLEGRVGKEIARKLKKLDAGFGYSSAACGSDILFVEEMLKRQKSMRSMNQDIEVNVILPIPADKFQKASVDIIPGSNWAKRYRRTLNKANRVVVATNHQSSESDMTFQYTNLLQSGLATIRAKAMDTDLRPLVVWDGARGDGIGGTDSMVKEWRSCGMKPEIIDISELMPEPVVIRQEPGAAKSKTGRKGKRKPQGYSQGIRAMLFADVVEYSKLFEEEIPRFVDHFMTPISVLAAKYKRKLLMKNTWGDALYFVFSSVQDAGNFALDLCDHISSVDWKSKGLPKNMNIRIALHAGPVFVCKDPILNKKVYTGTHVSRAARIEPITPPGYVYASQEFAALASGMRVTDFSLDYVGQISLPKEYGTMALFHVHRT